LRYQGSQPAGKNVIYNASLDVWQRGTSFNSTGNDYTADRWYSYRGGIATTVSRQTASLANFTYSIKTQRNSGNSFTTSIYLGQPLEIVDCMQFQGKTVTWSFWAKAGANYSAASSGLGVVLLQGTGSTDTNPFNVGYTGQSAAINTTATLTTSWQRFSYTVTLGSTITQLCPYLDFQPVGTAGADDSFQIVGMQLEASNVATTYARQNGTIQGELAACQRYYFRQGGNTIYQNYGTGYAKTSTQAWGFIDFPVAMRVPPTSFEFSNLAFLNYAQSLFAMTSVAIDANINSPYSAGISGTIAGGTAGHTGQVMAAGTAGSYVGFSAEL
jgi:hypothetical protein